MFVVLTVNKLYHGLQKNIQRESESLYFYSSSEIVSSVHLWLRVTSVYPSLSTACMTKT